MADRLLELSNVETGYGRSQVLFGVSLAIAPGEVVTLMGRNGMGKTTTVSTIMGLLPARRGTVEFLGQRVEHLPSFRIARLGLGLVPEGRQIFPKFTVHENLLMGAFIRTDARAVEAEMEDIYRRFPNLAARRDAPASVLSGGEQQMLAIGRALLTNPELLIMDEPMAGVDLASQEVLARTLKDQVSQGASVLLVLHELGPLEPLIDRAVVLRDGCVLHDGPPPRAVGQHALPGHDHVHPHAAHDAEPIRTGLLS
jgi:zinc transport system ATP-binding protein